MEFYDYLYDQWSPVKIFMGRGEKEEGVLPSAIRKKKYLFPQTTGRGGTSISISSQFAPDG
jgi:hypothetical protein